MLQPTENSTGHNGEVGLETAESRMREVPPEWNGKLAEGKVEERFRSAFPQLPAPEEEERHEDTRPVLAVFCYEHPDSEIGRFVTKVASALAKRRVAIHVFSRRDFELDSIGVGSHALGECDSDDLIAQVQEFASRACNAFLKLFPVGSAPVTLMGCEWSAVPALSLLRGLKNLDVLLSLHSLERQRGDLSSVLSQRIEEIESTGLRMAKAVLVQDSLAAEAAKATAPECAERIALVREMFPVHQFSTKLDPGEVKGRFQVGPLDPTILFVGDLEERYGPEFLVKAMPAILKNHPQARLVVVGEGSLYWPLRVFARYLLLEHAVRLVGSVTGQALHELIAASDVVVVPSRESTPWWPIQAAWAARRPVVATHPAAPGLLEHERDGVLCYPSENSCVWGIERVLFDAGLRQKLADNGSEKLDERFGWGSVAAQVEELMGAEARSV